MHFARGKSGSEPNSLRQADQLALVIAQWNLCNRQSDLVPAESIASSEDRTTAST
jgi:hypothetical protein